MSKTYRFVHPKDRDLTFAPKLFQGRDGGPRDIATCAKDGVLDTWSTWSHGKGKARAKAIATRQVRRHGVRELRAALITEL
jgi:hypothetical protein